MAVAQEGHERRPVLAEGRRQTSSLGFEHDVGAFIEAVRRHLYLFLSGSESTCVLRLIGLEDKDIVV